MKKFFIPFYFIFNVYNLYACAVFNEEDKIVGGLTEPVFEGKMTNGGSVIKFYERSDVFQDIKKIAEKYGPIKLSSEIEGKPIFVDMACEQIIPSTKQAKLLTFEIKDCTVITLWDEKNALISIFHGTKYDYIKPGLPTLNKWVDKFLIQSNGPYNVHANIISSYANYVVKAVNFLVEKNIEINGIDIDYIFLYDNAEDNGYKMIYDPAFVVREKADVYSKKNAHHMLNIFGKHIGINPNGTLFQCFFYSSDSY